MSDLTVVYYSACIIAGGFAEAVRHELLKALRGRFPIVCVSHRPIEFGDVRILMTDARQSVAQVYRNILAGCKAATTPFVAFAEDDTLYVPDHFTAFRPPMDTFAYNESRVVITRRLAENGRDRTAYFYARPRTQMAMGLCARDLMIETLEEKFLHYPNPPVSTDVAKKSGWGEPGRYEKHLGLSERKIHRHKWTDRPNVTWNHTESLMGRRKVLPTDKIYDSIEPWGNANDLWKRIHG